MLFPGLLSPQVLLTCCLIQLCTISPGLAIPAVGWALPQQAVINRKNAPRASLVGLSSQLQFLLFKYRFNQTRIRPVCCVICNVEDPPKHNKRMLLIGKRRKLPKAPTPRPIYLFLYEMDLCLIWRQRHHHSVISPTSVSVAVTASSSSSSTRGRVWLRKLKV